MSPAEAGRALALAEPPITDEQARAAAHLIVMAERVKAQDAA